MGFVYAAVFILALVGLAAWKLRRDEKTGSSCSGCQESFSGSCGCGSSESKAKHSHKEGGCGCGCSES